MSEEELTALQNQSVVVMGAAERGDEFTDAESEAAVAVVLAVPALCDEIRHLQAENRALRALLMSPYQGEYAYDNDAAIDRSLAAELASERFRDASD